MIKIKPGILIIIVSVLIDITALTAWLHWIVFFIEIENINVSTIGSIACRESEIDLIYRIVGYVDRDVHIGFSVNTYSFSCTRNNTGINQASEDIAEESNDIGIRADVYIITTACNCVQIIYGS